MYNLIVKRAFVVFYFLSLSINGMENSNEIPNNGEKINLSLSSSGAPDAPEPSYLMSAREKQKMRQDIKEQIKKNKQTQRMLIHNLHSK